MALMSSSRSGSKGLRVDHFATKARCASARALIDRSGLSFERQAGAHAKAAGGPGAEFELAAVEGHPLAHADEAVPAAVAVGCPGAVVGDLEPQDARLVAHDDPCARRPRVFERVRERFLGDAIGRELD